jgi:predicted ATP-binding protein involved in virulence
VKNETVQSWLLSLYGKEAIAKQRGETGESYRESFSRFERALAVALGEDIRLEVDIEPVLQLRLRFAGQSLNFSQLPDGIRSTAAWLADFMMRLNAVPWHSAFEGRKPGILLLDEADIHLHPKWQRTLLPAIRDALPDVQIIATSHSPFVISSCPDARVHVLKLDGEGRASALPPINAPIGESVTATLKDIFGVSSRFDIKTEQELREWNELTKKQVIGKIGAEEGRRLEKLIAILSERSEELRAIVGQPRRTPAIRVRSGASPGRRSPSAHSR